MVKGSPEAVLLGWKVPLLSHLQAASHDTLDENML